jgi:hypothetical protein
MVKSMSPPPGSLHNASRLVLARLASLVGGYADLRTRTFCYYTTVAKVVVACSKTKAKLERYPHLSSFSVQ